MARTIEEKSKLLKKFFTRLHFKYAEQKGVRYVNDNRLARELLDASPASYSRWISGGDVPDQSNAYKISIALSEKGFFEESQEICEILEYPPIVAVKSQFLLQVFKVWDKLPEMVVRDIMQTIMEYEVENNNDGFKAKEGEERIRAGAGGTGGN